MELPEDIRTYYKLYNGEKVICTKCGKGTYEPVGGDCKKTHCFICNFCGSKINMD